MNNVLFFPLPFILSIPLSSPSRFLFLVLSLQNPVSLELMCPPVFFLLKLLHTAVGCEKISHPHGILDRSMTNMNTCLWRLRPVFSCWFLLKPCTLTAGKHSLCSHSDMSFVSVYIQCSSPVLYRNNPCALLCSAASALSSWR